MASVAAVLAGPAELGHQPHLIEIEVISRTATLESRNQGTGSRTDLFVAGTVGAPPAPPAVPLGSSHVAQLRNPIPGAELLFRHQRMSGCLEEPIHAPRFQGELECASDTSSDSRNMSTTGRVRRTRQHARIRNQLEPATGTRAARPSLVDAREDILLTK